MTDHDPLAPIEALADNWARSYPSLVIGPQLRAALAEARQAVDALVAERDAYRRAKQENDERFMMERDEARAERDSIAFIHEGCAGLRRRDNEHLIKRAEKAEAERDGWEQRFRELQTESRVLPCDGGCVNAPEEDCSRHGRTPAELWRIIDEVRAERDAAREVLARVEALAASIAAESEAASAWLEVLTVIERAALARPATDEETE